MAHGAINEELIWEELQIQTGDLQRAHARAKRALDRYRSLFEQTPAGYLTVSSDGRVLQVHPSVRETLGMTEGVAFRARVHPDDRALFDAHLESVFRGREHTTCRVRLARAEGDDALVLLDTAPIPSQTDDPPPAARTVVSLARAKEVEASQLEQATALLDRTEGVLDIDADGRVRWASDGARALFRDPGTFLVGKLLEELFDSEQTTRLLEAVNETACPDAELVEMLAVRADETTFPAEFRICSSERLGREGTLVVLRDRSVEHLLQVELHQAQRLEALGRFAESVLLDVQNLLSGVWAAADVTLGVLGNRNAARPPLRMIREATRSALDLADMVLALVPNRTRSPRRGLLDPLVADMAPLLQRLAGSGVAVSVVLDAEGHQVLVEPGTLPQILLNLATNACDALPHGGSIEIRTSTPDSLPEHLDPGTSWVALQVSDNGVGIEPELQSRVFDPFYTTKGDRAGTGLGLSTVLGLVQAAGGDIELHSVPGEGAQFRVYLPSEAVDVPRAEVAERSSAASAVILIVDRQPLVLLSCEHLLRGQGHRVMGVGSATDARWAAQSLSLDLAIVEWEMPEREGLETWLREARPDLRIVYTTAEPRPADSAHLTRPVEPDRLQEAVTRALA